ncbi:heme-binding protein [Pelagibacterium halotolerans]|uniref:GlcG/HbpS family heme-binding protein n=1 Tax=Pelagibacterium halotolerans TaxID=531813 RepID=UPI00384EF4F0
MHYKIETAELTHAGAMAMLNAAIEMATRLGQPQCIVIVDASGEVRAELRMTGAKFLSRKSARAKAMTAASNGLPSADVPEQVGVAIGLATSGDVTGLPGGLPIWVDGQLLGGIGVGSGTGEQDIAVAKAALAVIGADR